MNSDPFCCNSDGLNGGTGPDALPKLTNMPRGRRQSSDAGKGVLADAVIDDVAQLAAGDFLHPRDEILLAVEDDMVAAIGLRELGLLLRADGADHGRAEMSLPIGR